MSEQPTGPVPEHRMEIVMPETHVAGVHADLVGVWHTRDSFVLDFSAIVEPARLEPVSADEAAVVERAQVVSRVRIPPSQVFEIMKALEQQLSIWERETGSRPTPPA
ncbi:MAG: DUF3467 domain-containing protein [Kineosporiaceae bacterium]